VHGDLKATARAVLGGQDGTVTAVDLRHPDPVLAGQGLGQRPFHDVLQLSEPVTVERQPVVLRDTPELGLELRDDTEVGIDDAFGSPDRPAVVQVGRAPGADHIGRHLQPDPRVDAAVTAPIVLVVGVQNHDLIAEEPGGLMGGGHRRHVRGRATEHAEKRAARMDKILTAASRRGLGTQTAVRLAANIDRDAHAMKRIARHNTVLISQPEAWT